MRLRHRKVLVVSVTAAFIWGVVTQYGVEGAKAMEPPKTGASIVETFPLTHLWFLYVLLGLYAAALAVRWGIAAVDRGLRLPAFLDRALGGLVRSGLAPVALAIPTAAVLYGICAILSFAYLGGLSERVAVWSRRLLVVAFGALVFGVPIRGSLLLIGLFGLVFLAGMLGQGLFISVVARNQLVATQAGALSSLLPSLLLSGMLVPIDNMPLPLRLLSRIIPAQVAQPDQQIVAADPILGQNPARAVDARIRCSAIGEKMMAKFDPQPRPARAPPLQTNLNWSLWG